jgi:Galactose oxidase, central domain
VLNHRVTVIVALACVSIATAVIGSPGKETAQATPVPSTPSARANAAMSFDAARGNVVLFGGCSFHGAPACPSSYLLSDTWIWDGSNWVKQMPAGAPSVTFDGSTAMAYDAGRQVVVMVGKFCLGLCSQMWSWDGGDWTIQTVSSPGLLGASMSSGTGGSGLLLVGGAQTWIWNGRNWSESASAVSPGRISSSVALDDDRGVVVLFGGFNLSGPAGISLFGDTWSWDGQGWTHRQPANSPPARMGAGTAYDDAHHQLVLFGGNGDGVTALDDTWTWDGEDWTEQHPLASPSPRSLVAMAYDKSRGKVVLFGGVGSDEGCTSGNCSQVLGDTWLWDGVTWTQATLTP